MITNSTPASLRMRIVSSSFIFQRVFFCDLENTSAVRETSGPLRRRATQSGEQQRQIDAELLRLGHLAARRRIVHKIQRDCFLRFGHGSLTESSHSGPASSIYGDPSVTEPRLSRLSCSNFLDGVHSKYGSLFTAGSRKLYFSW